MVGPPDSIRTLAQPAPSVRLLRAYRLPVVEVPDPPERQEPPPMAAATACPVEVRAIIQGSTRDTTFTVIAYKGESMLLSAGQGVKTAHGWLAISKIAPDHVVLRQGAVAHRCELQSSVAK